MREGICSCVCSIATRFEFTLMSATLTGVTKSGVTGCLVLPLLGWSACTVRECDSGACCCPQRLTPGDLATPTAVRATRIMSRLRIRQSGWRVSCQHFQQASSKSVEDNELARGDASATIRIPGNLPHPTPQHHRQAHNPNLAPLLTETLFSPQLRNLHEILPLLMSGSGNSKIKGQLHVSQHR